MSAAATEAADEVGDEYLTDLSDEYLTDLIGDPHALPDEKFPRVLSKRDLTKGYWVAMGLVMSVWMITPLCCAYLIWYALLAGRVGLTGTIFAAYAVTEVLFSLYSTFLIRLVQAPSPTSDLPLEDRNELFHRILHSGLDYAEPVRPRPTPASDAKGQEELRLYGLYERGQITKSEYYHARDREYEVMHGMQEGGRVAKMSEAQRDVVTSFVESFDGEREERLRKEIEADVGEDMAVELEGIVDKEGNIRKLHYMDRRAVEFRERMRTWFNNAEWSSLKRDNVLIWLSWTCFSLPYEEAIVNPKWREFLEASLELLEARTGTTFPRGYQDGVEVMRLTLDPVNAKSRPLILYVGTNLINWWLRAVVYPFCGMGTYHEGGIEYLVRIPHGWTPEKGRTESNAIPVVYLHGLGFGLLQSHLLVKHLLRSLPTHPLVIPIAHHTGQYLFHPRHLRPWRRSEFVPAIKRICEKWGFWQEPQTGGRGGSRRDVGGVSMLSHSNGSVAHGWILKDCPSLVKRSTFVDPVVFCLWEGDVCHAFCYRIPRTALELLLYYFIATELGISHYIQRHFDWADNTLFLDEIPNATDPTKTAFFLGGHDLIVNAARVRRYLERNGVTSGIHWDANAGHGDGLAGEARDRVVMYVGTGTTHNWQGWLSSGRGTHSEDSPRWKGGLRAKEAGMADMFLRRESEEEDSDRTLVGQSPKLS